VQPGLFVQEESSSPGLTLVFDREGCSPDFMARIRKQHIACLTYNTHPGEDWPEDEFQSRQVPLISGQTVEMLLAERGTMLGKKLWVREFRKLSKAGSQTSMVSTDYSRALTGSVAAMFAR
jgi:hypothetical protein